MTNCKYCGVYKEEPKGYRVTACTECVPDKEGFPNFIETVRFKDYHSNNGNVSKARVDMIKRRKINRDKGSNGEVILTDKFGKQTDRLARDY